MTSDEGESTAPALVPSGTPGLDDVMRGGFTPYGLYLVEGDPGSGKTTLALQFMMEGVRRGERCMYVTLSEDERELRAAAASHGWSLDGIDIFEIVPSEDSLTHDTRYTMYHPSEVELAETTKAVLAESLRIKPRRLVLDSLSELRMLAETPLRYRRQILALKRYFSAQRVTSLFIDDKTGAERDLALHSSAQGVFNLGTITPPFGATRRQLQVHKLRGRAFREGLHDFVIRHEGLRVYPRLVAAEHKQSYARHSVESGIPQLDKLLGGGLAKGTSTLVIGAAGTGKSSLATQFAVAAAARGEHSAIYIFDESTATFIERSTGLGLDVAPLMRSGLVSLRQIDPAELSPGEFAHSLREAVENDNAQLVVIDSLNGYLNATPSERFLTLHLHELLTYLGQCGATTLLLMTQHGIVGSEMAVPVDASYLADAVMSLRYFEAEGEIRQAISVIKKRTGVHERTIRELRFDQGIEVGEVVRHFEGVLTGFPRFVGDSRDLLAKDHEHGAGR
jgi:circadian clock protein KaiC